MEADPPREIAPPPVSPLPAVTVREEFCKNVLVTDPEGKDKVLDTVKAEVEAIPDTVK